MMATVLCNDTASKVDIILQSSDRAYIKINLCFLFVIINGVSFERSY